MLDHHHRLGVRLGAQRTARARSRVSGEFPGNRVKLPKPHAQVPKRLEVAQSRDSALGRKYQDRAIREVPVTGGLSQPLAPVLHLRLDGARTGRLGTADFTGESLVLATTGSRAQIGRSRAELDVCKRQRPAWTYVSL